MKRMKLCLAAGLCAAAFLLSGCDGLSVGDEDDRQQVQEDEENNKKDDESTGGEETGGGSSDGYGTQIASFTVSSPTDMSWYMIIANGTWNVKIGDTAAESISSGTENDDFWVSTKASDSATVSDGATLVIKADCPTVPDGTYMNAVLEGKNADGSCFDWNIAADAWNFTEGIAEDAVVTIDSQNITTAFTTAGKIFTAVITRSGTTYTVKCYDSGTGTVGGSND